jgi:hypothetical protein
LAWGDFGIGKTSMVLEMAEVLEYEFVEVLRPAERGEGALGVVPVPSEDRSVLEYPLPKWAADMVAREGKSLIFLDEVTSSPPALQPAIMGLALDGVIAGYRLPPRVHRAAAGNPVDQAASGWELAPALANRFVHLQWKSPSTDDWSEWLNGKSGIASVPRFEEGAWEKEWPSARALATSFMRSAVGRPCLHEDVAKVMGRNPPAFATPRTWESCIRLLASCRACGRIDRYATLAAGCVGEPVAVEWLSWLQNNDLPDPEEVLKDPDKWTPDAKRPDRDYAVLLAVAEAGLNGGGSVPFNDAERESRWEMAWRVMRKGLDAKLGKDVVLLACRKLADRERRPACEPGPRAASVLRELNKFENLLEV